LEKRVPRCSETPGSTRPYLGTRSRGGRRLLGSSDARYGQASRSGDSTRPVGLH
jgi:hypothetical protein